jgi:hypothetical protein
MFLIKPHYVLFLLVFLLLARTVLKTRQMTDQAENSETDIKHLRFHTDHAETGDPDAGPQKLE